ncbi:hypothetical protein Tco_1363085 [Tanacetum coccineum]
MCPVKREFQDLQHRPILPSYQISQNTPNLSLNLNRVGDSQKKAVAQKKNVKKVRKVETQPQEEPLVVQWALAIPGREKNCLPHVSCRYSEDNNVGRFHPRWDAPEQVDLTGDVPGATQEDLLGHDARPRLTGKPRPAKKTKSDAKASTGGSSASTQFEELMKHELRLKREAAERAFEAQAEKDRTLMRLEELRFLATSTKNLDDDDAYWIKKQKQLIKNKMRNDLGDEDDEDEDE